MASGETTLEFDGTMTDPLDVDGADGRAVLLVPTPEAILALAGTAEAELDASLDLEGRLEHHGDVWRLSAAKGIWQARRSPFGSHNSPKARPASPMPWRSISASAGSTSIAGWPAARGPAPPMPTCR